MKRKANDFTIGRGQVQPSNVVPRPSASSLPSNISPISSEAGSALVSFNLAMTSTQAYLVREALRYYADHCRLNESDKVDIDYLLYKLGL